MALRLELRKCNAVRSVRIVAADAWLLSVGCCRCAMFVIL